MDDQNQANNPFNSQPKNDQQTESTTPTPVDVEPATDSSAMPSASPVTSPAPTTPQVQTPSQSTPPVVPPVTPVSPTAPEREVPPAVTPQLIEAPKSKHGMLIVLIAVVLVAVFALVGTLVYLSM